MGVPGTKNGMGMAVLTVPRGLMPTKWHPSDLTGIPVDFLNAQPIAAPSATFRLSLGMKVTV